MCKTRHFEIPAGERQTYRNKPCLWEVNPELASQLVDPQDGWKLTAATIKKVAWTCGRHEWEATVANRSKGSGCPYCSGRVATLETCLATVNPELASQLVDQSLATELQAGSRRKVSWKCSEGHEWEAQVFSRSRGKGCPYCSGRIATKETCLATVNPELAKQLVDQSLGEKLTASSNKKVLWHCDCGCEWEAKANNRSLGSGCPKCASSKMNKLSAEMCEELGLDFAAEVRFDGCKSKQPLPFDIAILDESKKASVLVECQGRQHFESVDLFGGDKTLAKQQKHDQIKRDFCKREGIALIEIDYRQRDFTNADHRPGEWFKYALADRLFELGLISHEQLRSVSQGCSTFEPQEGSNLLTGVTRGRVTGKETTGPEKPSQDVQPGYLFDVDDYAGGRLTEPFGQLAS